MPALYILAACGIAVFAFVTLANDIKSQNWSNAVFAVFNGSLTVYAIVAFLGVRNSIVDVFLGMAHWVRVPARATTKDAPATAATGPVTAGWTSALYFGRTRPSTSNAHRSRSPRRHHRAAVTPAPTRGHDELPPIAPAPARTRISFLRVGVLLLCTALVGWFGMQAISSAVTPVAAPGPTYFSGYVDVTNTPAYPFETPPGPAQSKVTLAFVVSGPDDDCAPMWGGAYTLDAASSDLDLDRRIAQLRLVGGRARVSFGGAAGTELGLDVHRPVGPGRRVPGSRRPVRLYEHRPRPRGHLPGRRGSRGASGRRDQGRPGRRAPAPDVPWPSG